MCPRRLHVQHPKSRLQRTPDHYNLEHSLLEGFHKIHNEPRCSGNRARIPTFQDRSPLWSDSPYERVWVTDLAYQHGSCQNAKRSNVLYFPDLGCCNVPFLDN